MTFYDSVKKMGKDTLYITLPKKWAKQKDIQKGDFIEAELKKKEVPKLRVD